MTRLLWWVAIIGCVVASWTAAWAWLPVVVSTNGVALLGVAGVVVLIAVTE